MPYLMIAIDITKGKLVNAEDHDAELSAILQQAHSAMVLRALPQELFDTERTVVGEVRYQERAPFAFYTGPEVREPATPPKKNRKGRAVSSPAAGTGTASKRLSYPPAVHYPREAPRGTVTDNRGKKGKRSRR